MLETESENDREASSCSSPTQIANANLEGSSENDKDIVDGAGCADDDLMGLVCGVVGNSSNNNNNISTNELNNSLSAPTTNHQQLNTQATFHGSRSSSHIGRKPAFGQTCSMKTLLQDGILQTGEKVLTLEYEGAKFFGDLRRDGTIMMRGPDEAPHIYATPVAWANHCCKMLNPESKPLNAWSSIRFRGKRLDSYKLKWYRAQKKPNMMNNSSNNNVGGVSNLVGGINMNLQNNEGNALNVSIIKNLHQNLQHQQQNLPNQQGSSRLMIHNPITNYFPQYENPIKNKKLIKSVLISNNMDYDCKRLVMKSLDMSVDPCIMTQQLNNNNVNNNNSNINNVEAENNNDNDNDNDNDNNNNNDDINANNNNNNNNDDSIVNNNHCSTLRTTVINYEQLGTRGPHNTHNPNTMVKCIPFSVVDRIQPFNVTVSTNALLLVDFHSHLVSGEVAGYLAGFWDASQHTLTVTQAFPCRTSLSQETTASNIEEEIKQDIEKRNLTVVGWYHSHQGKYSNHPTIKDIQNQMEHQITMKDTATGYSPCIGLICSPHDIRSEDDLSPSFQIYWVMPPPEHMVDHYGRPMQMYYSVTRDLFLTQDLLLEMRLLANYYTSHMVTDMVDFKSVYEYNDRITYLDKLSGSIKPKLPKDLQESEYPDEPAIWKAAVDHFWKFLKNLVIVPSEQAQDQQEEGAEAQEEQEEEENQCDQDDLAPTDAEIATMPELCGNEPIEEGEDVDEEEEEMQGAH